MTKRRTAVQIEREKAYRRGLPLPLDSALAALQSDERLVQAVEDQLVAAAAQLIARNMKVRGIHLTRSESNDLALGTLAVVGTRLADHFKPTQEVTAHFKQKLAEIRRVAC